MTTDLDAKLREIVAQAYRDDGFEIQAKIIMAATSNQMEAITKAMRRAFAYGRETMRNEAIAIIQEPWRPRLSYIMADVRAAIRAIPIMPEEKAE